MRATIFLAGIGIAVLGFTAFRQTNDPSLLQGGLTLGGGFVICGIFSLSARWHGYVGAGILGMLGAARTLPTLLTENGPGARFKAVACAACVIVMVGVLRALLAEHARRGAEKMRSSD